MTNFTRPPTSNELRHREALWGPRPQAEPHQPKMRLVGFKPIVKGSLRGFATVELAIGLRIHDIPVLFSNGKIWASLPSKPQIDQDGRHRKDVNGKAAYTAILEWRDRALSDRFSAAVVGLVRAEHPDDLGDLP